MSENQLTLRTINELIDKNEQFYIPAYQRGYRWIKRQVEDLLNDILEFHHKEKKQSEFYCLQPIVVRASGEKWELIDGQQRLTTLFIILSYFNRRMAEEFRKQLFSIEYDTRPNSQQYLLNINEEEKDLNIDFYHMYGAFEVVKAWFYGKENLINDIESILLNRVKVIWYEIREKIDPVEVFTRLNIGKIPLTNAELVKALFLRSGNFGQDLTHVRLRQLQIAQEWDDMERALQDDEFWYFLTNEKSYATRIEFILELVAGELDDTSDIKHDPYYVFIAFNRWFNNEIEGTPNADNPELDSRWDNVRYYFLQLEEWFKDRYWFHLIGFLINQGVPIREIRRQLESAGNKQIFRDYLKQRIYAQILPGVKLDSLSDEQVEVRINEATTEWEYGAGSRHIRPALLLFNVASLLRNPDSNQRFQFDGYKKDNWDLEHVRSVKSGKHSRPDDQKRWLQSILSYFTGTTNQHEYSKLVSEMAVSRQRVISDKALAALDSIPFKTELFDKVYSYSLRYFKESDEGEADNSIANMALLDSSTNRSYGNEVFPVKRNRIIALDKKGSFVPLCTKNVFLKYYSTRVDNMMFWCANDREDYGSSLLQVGSSKSSFAPIR
ncbi:MAG: DUF262 domain-containing protein [Gammaproteobacteria bacterium]|nr:DUF262 domain-containing protein [Gammaproteobacteria bacterium]